MDDLKSTYNRIAEDWHRDHQADSWWVDGTDAFVSMLSPGARVLDVGCGSGVKSKYLVNRGLSVHGIDFSDAMIAIAKREVPEAVFEVLDMREADKVEGEFEGVFVQAALLHIPKAEALSVLRGLARKLTPSGLLYVAVKGKREGGKDEEVVSESDYGYAYERFFSYFSELELKEMLSALGMRILFSDTKPTGRTAWVQVIART